MPSTYVVRKNEITQVNDTCKGKISLIGMLGTLTDPSKLHLLHFGYWWLNLSFLLLLKFQGPEEDALATLKTVSPAVHKYGTENTYVCTWDL